MKRVAAVIGVSAETVAEYESHHRAVWPGVLARLRQSHVHNYSIYRSGDTLFSYYEYTGSDYEADLEAIASDPETQRWWALVNPLQRPFDDLPAGVWKELPELFHTD